MKHYSYTKNFPQKTGNIQDLIQDQRAIIKKTERFLNQFSINRYLNVSLTQFSEKETINLLETLKRKLSILRRIHNIFTVLIMNRQQIF